MKQPDDSRAGPWQLWLATPEAAERFDPGAQSFADRQRWARMAIGHRRAEWETSRALLAYVGRRDLTRSLSHSGGFAALALAPARVRIGIDIEQVHDRYDCMRIARFAFAPEEAAQMETLDGSARRERFYVLWTLKEACIKTLRLTLLAGLRQCVFTLDDDRWLASVPTDATWAARVFRPRPGLYLAVLSLPPAPALTRHEWPWAVDTLWPLIADLSSVG